MKQAIKRAVALTLGIILAILPVAAWLLRQNIFDWTRLHNYQPNAAVVKLATDTTMDDYARHLFYVYHPSIESKQTFSQNCSENEKTIVLGCYVSMQGIYIYDVKDTRLAGVEEVTAAHEMLHAAYDRLKPQEKQKINLLIQQAYSQVTDKRIRSNIDSYQQAGADTTNELHSILGTEVRNLPPDLETYYKRYFTDRAKIVSYSEQYQQIFTDRQNKVAADDVNLKNIKIQIDALDASLKSQSQSLTADRQNLNNLLARGQTADYNAAVPSYNAKVTAYNADIATEQSLVDEYNTIVKERNALALEENELVKAIDSRPSTLPAQ